MWMGLTHYLRQISVDGISILSQNFEVVESVRDLGVVIDNQTSLSAHISALCRSAYCQLRQVRPAARSLTTEAAKTSVIIILISSRIYIMPPGLLQFTVTRCVRRSHAASPVSTECRSSTPYHWSKTSWPHHARAASVVLPSFRQRMTFRLACLMHQSLCGHAPACAWLSTFHSPPLWRRSSPDSLVCH